MADLFLNQGQVDRNTVYDTQRMDPNVVRDVRSGTGNVDELVRTLDGFMNSASKMLDRETVRKAQLAGATAGLSDGFKTMEGSSLAAEQFNRAGTETYINRKVAEVSTTIQKTALDPKVMNDPVRMRHTLEDLRGDLSKDVPMDVLPQYLLAFNDRAERAIQSAQERKHQLMISANEAQFLETEAALVAEATNAARGGDENQLNQSRAEYFSAINKQVGLSLSPAEAAKRKILFSKQVQKDAVVGEMLRVPADERPAFMEKFLKDNPLNEILTAEEIDGVKQDIISAYNTDENLIKAANAETSRINQENIDKQKIAFTMAPTSDNYLKLIQMPDITAEEISSAKSYMSDQIDKSDPVVIDHLNTLFYSGQYKEMSDVMLDPKYMGVLKRSDTQKFRMMIAEVEQGSGFETTEAYREVQRRISEDYKGDPLVGELLSGEGNAIRQQVYDELRTKWPKFKAGELSYEDVDPLRLYKAKKANVAAVEGMGQGREIKTSKGVVTLPQKYIENPVSYAEDLKSGLVDPRLKSIEVQKYVADEMVRKELEQKKANQ